MVCQFDTPYIVANLEMLYNRMLQSITFNYDTCNRKLQTATDRCEKQIVS